MAVANFNAIAALANSYAIRFNASPFVVDLYEFAPSDGELLNKTPASMFVDTTVHWIERVRSVDSAPTYTDNSGASYRQAYIALHDGASQAGLKNFLDGTPDSTGAVVTADWSYIIINETTEEWIMWPAFEPGNAGGSFVVWTVVPTYITDTGGLLSSAVQGIAESFSDGQTPGAAGTFQDALLNSELVVALIPNNTFRPTFGGAEAQVQADVESGTPSLTASVRTTPPPARIRGDVESGVPSLTASVKTTSAPARVRADVESGAPTLTASVKTTPPPARIRADVESGTPSLAATVRTTPAPARARAVIESGAPTLTASVRTTPAAAGFTTADFDQTGLDVIALGLITAGAPVDNTIYRSAENGGPLGSLAAGGDLELQTGQSITRIARNIQTDDIRIWDNPSSLTFTDFFNDNPDLSLRIQFPSSGPYILTRGGQGGNFSNWQAPTTTARNEIDAISEGDEFIIAVAQTTPALEARVQGDAESGAPTVTAQVRTTPPPSRVRGAVEAGAPTLTARVRTEAPGEIQVSGDIASGAPTVAARVRATRNIRVQADIESGTPTVTARVRTTAQGEARIQGAIESGAPTLAAQVRTTPPPIRVRGAVEAGTPTLMARVRTEAPGEAKIQGDIESGVPSVVAQVRQTRSIRIRGTIQSGVPTVDAEVRQTRRIRVRGAVESGVPSVAARIIAAVPQRVRAAIESGVPDS